MSSKRTDTVIYGIVSPIVKKEKCPTSFFLHLHDTGLKEVLTMSYNSYSSTWELKASGSSSFTCIWQSNNSIAVCHDPKYGKRPKLCPKYKECVGASIVCGEHFTGDRERTARQIPLSEFDYTKGEGTGWNSVIRDEDSDAFMRICGIDEDDDEPFGGDFDDSPSQYEIDQHVSRAESGYYLDKLWCDENNIDYDKDEYWRNS